MFPRHIICSGALVAVILFGGSSTVSSEPSLQHRFTVPGFYNPVERAALADIDGDHKPEVLAADGEKVTLFCPEDDVVLFSAQLEANCINYDILFDDVTGDMIADIVIGQYCQLGTYGGDTVCKVELYHSGSAYTTKDSAMFAIDAGGLGLLHSPFLTVNLQALDLTGDGQNEMFLSYDRHRVFPSDGHHCLATTGYSCLYDPFPSVTLWDRPYLYGRLDHLITHDNVPYWATTRYENFSSVPGDITSIARVEIVTGDGEIVNFITEPFEVQCLGDSTDVVSFTRYQTCGNIRPDDYTEILAERIWEQTCFISDAVSEHHSGSALRLYRFVAPDQLELVWSVTDPPAYSNFFYSPSYPGSFFAIQGDDLYQMNGDNGAVLRMCGALGADTLFWARIPGMSEGSLVGIDNQTISVYLLDMSTAVETDQMPGMPESFALGQPYPNPFNPSCVIEYSLPRRCHTRISVYNILGQRVTTLVDESKAAGNHTVVWDGTDQSGKRVGSGFYLYRMQAGEFVDSRKMVLLK